MKKLIKKGWKTSYADDTEKVSEQESLRSWTRISILLFLNGSRTIVRPSRKYLTRTTSNSRNLLLEFLTWTTIRNWVKKTCSTWCIQHRFKRTLIMKSCLWVSKEMTYLWTFSQRITLKFWSKLTRKGPCLVKNKTKKT